MSDDPRLDAELEQLRRSLAMLPSNHLALTRDQALALISHLQHARRRLRQARSAHRRD